MQLGAHISTAGGIAQAPARAADIGCDGMQVFTRNQRSWQVKPLSEQEIADYRAAVARYNLGTVMSHGSYLANPASPDEEKWQRSIQAMSAELERCHLLGIPLYNFHPGAHLDSGLDAGIARCAEAINILCEQHPEADDVTLVLENVAGQGTTIGARFEQLARIIEQVETPERCAVCLDTAHAFAAGYALHTKAGWEAMWEEFDNTLGLKRLAAFHLNDSAVPFGSHRDRHALIGRGHIGPEAFIRIVTDPRTREIPMFLETPAGPDGWALELAWLRAVAQGRHPPLPEIEAVTSGL
jgi:deoxyribonuclease-4